MATESDWGTGAAELTRVETMPASGWLPKGQPVEWWADEALRNGDAMFYLAERVAGWRA